MSWINSAARAKGSIWPCVKRTPNERTFGPYCTGWFTSSGNALSCVWPHAHISDSVQCSMASKPGAFTSNTWRRSSMCASSSGNAAWQRWHCLGNGWCTVSIGSATRLSVLPLCPTWPPTLLPGDSRRERVFFASPSDEGGLLELWLFLFTFDSSASRRASSVRIIISFSPCDRPARSVRSFLCHGPHHELVRCRLQLRHCNLR